MTKTGILKGIPDAYLVLIKTIYELKGVKTVLSSRDIIWNNALIRYKGSLLFFTNWIKHKMTHVYDSNRKFMSFEQIVCVCVCLCVCTCVRACVCVFHFIVWAL